MAPAPPALLEIGAVLLGIGVLSRVAARAGVPPIVAPLAVGLLATGAGPLPDGFAPPPDVTDAGAGIALVLLLFSLGLDQTRADRAAVVRSASRAGLVDATVNLVPGLLGGMLLGWGVREAVLLGGATWASSPVAARWIIGNLGRVGNRETPGALSLLTLENLGMCVFLPLAAALCTPAGGATTAVSVLLTAAAVAGAAWVARDRGPALRRPVFGHADDVVLTVAGVALVVAGLAAEVEVPAAAGALLAGAVLAGPVTTTEPARAVLGLLRHLSAAGAFVSLGLLADIDGPGIVVAALLFAVVGGVTKLTAGWWAARHLRPRARLRTGSALIARGEFSVALALIGHQTGLDPDLVAVTAVYVAVTLVAGGLMAGTLDPSRGDVGAVRAGRAPVRRRRAARP